MIVQQLFSVLGLKVDEASWAKGDKFLSAVKAGFAGVVAGFGIASIKHMIDGVAEMADEAGKTAQKLGITTEAVQELGYAAKLSDVEAGEFNAAMFRLSRGLQDVAKDGKGPAADALKKLGIRFSELKGETLDQNLERIAEGFKKMPDGPKKAALAMDLFGRAGTKLIPFLNSGQEGIVELRNEAERLGIVVSEDAAKQFEEFNDAQTKLSETWRGIKTQVVTALLPTLMHLIESFQGWIDTNREMIQQGLHTVISAVTFAVKGLAFAVDHALKFLAILSSDSDILHGLLIALGAAMTYFAVMAVAAWVAAAAPVIAFIAIVTAVYVGISKLIKHWDKVKEAAGRAWSFIKDKAADFLSFVLSIPGKILGAFIDLGVGIISAVGNAFDWVLDKAKKLPGEVWSAIKDIPVIGDIASGAESLVKPVNVGYDPVAAANAAVARNAEVVSDGNGVGGITVGDTTFQMTINASEGMDAEQLAELAAQKADEKQKQRIADAYDTLRGGRR